jgi:predicted  nucleic acid-binding Zn-ribbon protein
MIETPLITNDPMGLAKLVIAIVVGTSPIYGLVIAFLRKGPNDAIARLITDLNGYGERLNKVDREHAADQQEVGQLVVRMAQSEQDRHGIRNDVTRVETRVVANEQRIEKNQQAILDAAHKIELQVASLAAKADVGKELRDGLERIADLMEKRDARRGEQQ